VKAGLALLGVAAGAAIAYVRVVRPWQTRWGATDEEVARLMQGDEMIVEPDWLATRAVTVEALPEQVWPWIVQIGFGRAGWYGIDWIDNLGRHSSERVIPELQHVEPGDHIPMSPWTYMVVKAFEPERWMLWTNQDGTGTWCWGLYPFDEGRTRLVTRMRSRYHWRSPLLIGDLLVDAFDIFFMRACLLGIKRRAEGLVGEGAAVQVAG
jgi:hypothetical protein